MPSFAMDFPAIAVRVTSGLGDEAAAVLARYGVCVVAGWADTSACVSHLGAVEALVSALPRPRAPHWPPPPGWLHYPLITQQREWLTAAGQHAAAAEAQRRGNRPAAWLLEGHGCHVGMAWAWRAEALPWFQRWHAEPCVAAVEPVWVRVPRLAPRNPGRVLTAPFPRDAPVDAPPTLRACLLGQGGEESFELPFAAGPPVAPHDAPIDGAKGDAATLARLAWTRPTERPLSAHVVVSCVACYRFVQGAARLGLDLAQGDLVLWDPALWHLSGAGMAHPSDGRPGCALAHVMQPVACHPVRLEPNTVAERVDAVRTGRRPPLCPAGTSLYPLATTVVGLAPLTGAHVHEDVDAAAGPRSPVRVKAEEVAVKLEEPPELSHDEMVMWQADGFLPRSVIDRNPEYWAAVVRGSRVVEQPDGSVFVENAGVFSAPFTQQQAKASKIWGQSPADTGASKDKPSSSENAPLSLRGGTTSRAGTRNAVEAAKLEGASGPLDPLCLGWSAQRAADLIDTPAVARAIGLCLPPLRCGPRATGNRPWEQALRRLMPQSAGALPVVAQVTTAMRAAFELCASGTPPELTANWAARLPLWQHNQAGRITQILADGDALQPATTTTTDPHATGAVLCPWGLPVAVFAGPREVTRSCSARVRQGDPQAIEIVVPECPTALDDAEQHVAEALDAAVANGVRRAGAAVVLVLPRIQSPSALLDPEAGPVRALAVLLTWVDPWLQAHMAHRLAAWTLACIVPCLERRPVPFTTMAAPSRDTIDHIRVTRTRQWMRDGDRGSHPTAAAALVALRSLRADAPLAGRDQQPPGGLVPGGFLSRSSMARPELQGLIPSAQPFGANVTSISKPKAVDEEAPTAKRKRARTTPTPRTKKPAERVVKEEMPMPRARLRRGVDPKAYSKRMQRQRLLDELDARLAGRDPEADFNVLPPPPDLSQF